MRMQSIIHAVYPPQCVACDAAAMADNGLCGLCWAETQFIGGTICDTCGAPLLGDDFDEIAQCDDCMTIARPWNKGRAALAYSGIGRKLVLRFKHGDRTDLAKPLALWMATRAEPLIKEDTVIVPVPLHWVRLLSRRYNQAAELARALGPVLGVDVCPDALTRPRRTPQMKRQSRADRFAALAQSMAPNPKRAAQLSGRSVLLVDDVMTTGATLAAATEACLAAGADHVNVLALARAVKDT
mgnify:CR=1 FL=1